MLSAVITQLLRLVTIIYRVNEEFPLINAVLKSRDCDLL